MANLQIMKDGVDITDKTLSDKYDDAVVTGLKNLFIDNPTVFNSFSGIFSIQFSFDRVFYSYLGNDSAIDSLLVPKKLIDAVLNKANQDFPLK